MMPNELDPLVSRSDRGYVKVLDSSFAASFVDGIWYSTILFTADEGMEDFSLVRDRDEAARIVADARRALAVQDPRPPGDAYASLLGPLTELVTALGSAGGDPLMEEFRLGCRRERARLQLRRYPLSFGWVGLLWQVVLEDRLRDLPEARQAAASVASALSALLPDRI